MTDGRMDNGDRGRLNADDAPVSVTVSRMACLCLYLCLCLCYRMPRRSLEDDDPETGRYVLWTILHRNMKIAAAHQHLAVVGGVLFLPIFQVDHNDVVRLDRLELIVVW